MKIFYVETERGDVLVTTENEDFTKNIVKKHYDLTDEQIYSIEDVTNDQNIFPLEGFDE